MDIKKVLIQWFNAFNGSMVNFFDKKASATWANKFASSHIKNKNILNEELVEELHEPIIRKCDKKKSKLTFYRQYFGC